MDLICIAFCGNFQICGMPFSLFSFGFIGEMRSDVSVILWFQKKGFYSMQKCKYFMPKDFQATTFSTNLKSQFSQITMAVGFFFIA